MATSATHHPPKIIFVTGTDTGAGKTLLTALLLYHLRQTGVRALAMKPFCSGGTADVDLLSAIQNEELPKELMNPFYFKEPVAPLIAARKHRRKIELGEVLERIREVEKRCDCLLIEGSGGLLVPLGEGYSVLDLIAQLRCKVVVAARNRLGVINHTLLTVKTMQAVGIKNLTVSLMNIQHSDISALSNKRILQEILRPIPVYAVLFLGGNANRPQAIKINHKKTKKILALIANIDNVSSVDCETQ